MVEEITAGGEPTELRDMVMVWRHWFVKNLKPVVWHVHASVVSKVFRYHGALNYMMKYADLVEKHGVSFSVVDA
jgi:hypothetical protein